MKILLVLLAVATSLVGCATQPRQPLQGPVYSQYETRNAANVLRATVVSVNPAVVQSPVATTWQGTAASGAAGGAVGAAIGNKIGRGNGKKLATTLGALGGAAVGVSIRDAIAEQESKKQGIEIVVRLMDGSNRELSVLQEVSNTEHFYANQTVIVTQQRGGYHVSPL